MLLGLVGALLNRAKLEAGRVDLAIESAELGSLVSATISQLNQLATDADVRIAFDVDASSVCAEVDSDQFQRVVTNLVGNAVKFSPAGGTVRILLREARQPTPPRGSCETRAPAYLRTE